MSDGIDWAEIERAATAQIVDAVRAVRRDHPDEHVYGAMFHEFYGDGALIGWPMVTVGTTETLAEVVADYVRLHGDSPSLEADLRWSGPDLSHGFDPTGAQQALADRVQSVAGQGGGFDAWERVYDRFLHAFPAAAKRARTALAKESAVTADFIAIAADEAGELIALSLTKAQLRRHFPHADEAERERRRLAALPVAQRAAELLREAVLPRYDGPLVGEHAALLVACGAAALPGLTRVVRGEEYARGAVVAARLLAEINIDAPEVVQALDERMRATNTDVSTRAWAASALARMGRSDLILAAASVLPEEVIVRGIADPLRSFRDRGAHRRLDYAPVEAALVAVPTLEAALKQELRPGVGFCALTPDEHETARAALRSEWKVIRRHARIVLEDAGVSVSDA